MVKGKIGKNIEKSQKYYETDRSCLLTEFDKWCPICVSVCGVGDMFAWEACLRGWHASKCSVGGVGGMFAWMAW